ncbi:hypothetical protein KKF84_02215 [Myxococcota bacterium]|nr:hypothetical protein [Myxococcota bacterium]
MKQIPYVVVMIFALGCSKGSKDSKEPGTPQEPVKKTLPTAAMKQAVAVVTPTDPPKATDRADEIIKRIGVLPKGYAVKKIAPGQLQIYSQPMKRRGFTNNNGIGIPDGVVTIDISILRKFSQAEVWTMNKYLKSLLDSMPPQKSKDNLKAWHKQNAPVLQKISKLNEFLPTHYDAVSSFQMNSGFLPADKADMATYQSIKAKLESLFSKYQPLR